MLDERHEMLRSFFVTARLAVFDLSYPLKSCMKNTSLLLNDWGWGRGVGQGMFDRPVVSRRDFGC